jgi:predicted DNA-binding protein
MSKRFTFVLPDEVAQDLEDWASQEGRATANLIAFLVEQTVRIKYPEKYPPQIKRRDD